MLKLNFLAQSDTPEKMCIGEAVLRLGQTATAHNSLLEYALPLMRDVAKQFSVSVSLSSRFGADMLIVQRATSSEILQLDLHVGSTYELLNSAAGWAYLCGLSPSERRMVLDEIRSERPEHFSAYRANFKEALAEYESNGYVIGLGKMHPLVNAIGVPVISLDRRRVMAINCGGVSLTCTPEVLRGDLGIATKALAAKLGSRLGSVPEIRRQRG